MRFFRRFHGSAEGSLDQLVQTVRGNHALSALDLLRAAVGTQHRGDRTAITTGTRPTRTGALGVLASCLGIERTSVTDIALRCMMGLASLFVLTMLARE